MLDRGDLVDPETDRGRRGGPGRDAVGDVGGRPDRLARHDDEPRVEGAVVDGDAVEALADLEIDALPVVLEGDPASVGPQLEARPAEDEGAMRVVLEFLLGVDPAADPDVARRPGRQRPGLADADRPRRGEQAPDPIARSVGPQDEDAGDERDEPGDEGDQG